MTVTLNTTTGPGKRIKLIAVVEISFFHIPKKPSLILNFSCKCCCTPYTAAAGDCIQCTNSCGSMSHSSFGWKLSRSSCAHHAAPACCLQMLMHRHMAHWLKVREHHVRKINKKCDRYKQRLQILLNKSAEGSQHSAVSPSKQGDQSMLDVTSVA